VAKPSRALDAADAQEYAAALDFGCRRLRCHELILSCGCRSGRAEAGEVSQRPEENADPASRIGKKISLLGRVTRLRIVQHTVEDCQQFLSRGEVRAPPGCDVLDPACDVTPGEVGRIVELNDEGTGVLQIIHLGWRIPVLRPQIHNPGVVLR
jgi:hypothetical protein